MYLNLSLWRLKKPGRAISLNKSKLTFSEIQHVLLLKGRLVAQSCQLSARRLKKLSGNFAGTFAPAKLSLVFILPPWTLQYIVQIGLSG